MGKIEKTFEQEVYEYLQTPAEDRNIETGAKLLLQGTRNRVLHQNVLRRNWHEKVNYELTKILGDYAPEETPELLAEKQQKIIDGALNAQGEKLPAEGNFKGKRSDHDQLPEEIAMIPEVNRGFYQEMRSLHEKLKLMNGEEYNAEARKPILDKFLAIDADIVANWKVYDSYVVGEPTKKAEKKDPIDAKRITSNRTFFSRLPKEGELKPDQLADAQLRFDEMKANDIAISADILAKLQKLGVKTESNPEENQETKPEGTEEVTPAAEPVQTDEVPAKSKEEIQETKPEGTEEVIPAAEPVQTDEIPDESKEEIQETKPEGSEEVIPESESAQTEEIQIEQKEDPDKVSADSKTNE